MRDFERSIPDFSTRGFTIAEYHRLLEVGILVSGDPYELLEGWVVEKPRKSPRHAVAQSLVDDAIRAKLPIGCHLRLQSAITLAESEPEPDAVVIRGSPRDFPTHLPFAADIRLIIEIADTSLEHDRLTKGRIYARAGVPEYWIVNLVNCQIEVYTDPTGDIDEPEFRRRQDFVSGDFVPLRIEGSIIASVPVDDLLP